MLMGFAPALSSRPGPGPARPAASGGTPPPAAAAATAGAPPQPAAPPARRRHGPARGRPASPTRAPDRSRGSRVASWQLRSFHAGSDNPAPRVGGEHAHGVGVYQKRARIADLRPRTAA